jgi:5-methyltetrahydropteroyltriglutamate--homocysteine methyltransferase
MAALSTNLGFPRMGPYRELKRALESYWTGDTDAAELQRTAAELREGAWRAQHDAGIDHIPSGDFSLYDHVLDTACMVGAIPDRHRSTTGAADLDTYFAMARGGRLGDRDVTALEMTKWFDTNYHYLVPELRAGQPFELTSTKAIDEFTHAASIGVTTRPVLLGPVSFLLLAKHDTGADPLAALEALTAVYASVLARLADAGAAWVQIDEPVLGLDLDAATHEAMNRTYQTMRDAAGPLRILVATYFAGLRNNLRPALALPVDAVHLDVTTEPTQLDDAVAHAPESLMLSVGIVDGRNVWRTDLNSALSRLEAIRDRVGADRLLIGPSCSLLHLPVDLDLEPSLDDEVRSWLAFASQRLDEIVVLTRGLNDGRDAIADELAASTTAVASRAASTRVHNPDVQQRMRDHHPSLEQRPTPYRERVTAQHERLGLPLLPTTTIGSFPKTADVRSLRARHNRGDIDDAIYTDGMRDYIRDAVAFQDEIGLDVLVHGEPERNDMVEYFGGLLDGCTVTANGWVQSYGSRCVKPPLIFGDVARPAPMTVEWARYAQSLTPRPVKGMLTGPVTILQWSFVRSDQPVETTCRQIAFAIRDEVTDLEAAGISAIQIDEPALREGLPLHAEDHKDFLAWAVAAFRLASSGVRDDTQIHTHMCYGEFNDIIESIAAFDADVISVEASRSRMELLAAFSDFEYPNEIGPGLFDIHSPRIPPPDEMADLLEAAIAVVPAERVWVNPDCGLKTRRWEEVRPALANMVHAARLVRERLAQR